MDVFEELVYLWIQTADTDRKRILDNTPDGATKTFLETLEAAYQDTKRKRGDKVNG